MSNSLFRVFAFILIFLGSFLSQLCIAQGVVPGTVKWTYPVDTVVTGCAIPAIGHNGTIYVPSGHRLLAINPDGTLKWSFDTGLNDQYVGISSNNVGIPSVDSNDNIYFVVSDGNPSYIYALSSNKNLLWVKELYANPSGGFSSSCGEVAIGPDSTIYASGSNKIQAFTPAGQPKWIARAGEMAPTVNQSGSIFTFDWIYYSGLYELNSVDGSIYRSSSPTSIGVSYPLPPVMGFNGDIYIAGSSGLVKFNEDLTRSWDNIPGRSWSPVIDIDGTVYYTGSDSNGYYFNSINKDGMQIFKSGL